MKERFVKLYKAMTANEGKLFVYAFSYSLIASLAPFLVIAVVGTSLIDMEQVIDFLVNYIPQDLLLPFVEYLQQNNPSSQGWVVITLLVASLWLASKSIYSFLIISSEHDNVKITSIVLRILSVVDFVLLMIGVVIIALTVGFVPDYRNSTVLLVLFLFYVLFYRMISFRYIRIRDLYLGSLTAAILIALLGKLFFTYINQFTNYQTIYGPLASVMVLFISGYAISWVTYFGYCVNYAFRNENDDVHAKTWLLKYFAKEEK